MTHVAYPGCYCADCVEGTPSARITGDKDRENPVEGAPTNRWLAIEVKRLRNVLRYITELAYVDHQSGNQNYEYLQGIADSALRINAHTEHPMTDEQNERAALANEARLDAKAFRENTVYDSDGNSIRLIANADRLDQYADRIEALEAENARLREANYRTFTDGMEAAAQICGSLAEVKYDDADGFEAATGCEAAAMTQTHEQIAAGLTEDELLEEFRALFNWRGCERLTAKQWADEHGFSQAYVSDVLRGKRGIADRFAEALGYQRVVTFVPIARNLLEKNNG